MEEIYTMDIQFLLRVIKVL